MLLTDKNENPGNLPHLDLPDIARETRVELTGRLDRVGMSEIEVPVLIKDRSGVLMRQPAKAEAFVSLDDPFAKGIHMSRLFLQLGDALSTHELSLELLGSVLKGFVATHVDISHSSFVRVNFEKLLERKALKSQHKGWRSYPVAISGTLVKGVVRYEIDFTVTYSSTCPCSAALARKLIQDAFRSRFSDEAVSTEAVYEWLGTTQGILATPHSQRSYAQVKVRVDDPARAPKIEDLIDFVESRLATPVQAAVKREDEQEFALINGQNLMFCEDAARKLKGALNEKSFVADYWVKVSHVESLHPHNAVAIVTKGVAGGYEA